MFRTAAQAGNAVAQNRLAYLLAQGRGTEESGRGDPRRDRAKAAGLGDSRLDLLLAQSAAEGKANATQPIAPAEPPARK